MKKRIYHLVETGDHGSKINSLFDNAILALIMLNVIAMVLESISSVNRAIGTVLYVFELVSVIIFSIEYLFRIYVSDITHPSSSRWKSVLKFSGSFYGVIDLVAILPFYLPLLISFDLRFLRMLRLFRLLRVMKLNRYSNSFNLIWQVIKEKRSELIMSLVIIMFILFLSSFAMYSIENTAQPDKFSNVLTSFWWAIATLTTVGYGDIYPVTHIGKIVGGFIALMGVGLVAIPTGLISAGFIEKLENQKIKKSICPHCGNDIGNG